MLGSRFNTFGDRKKLLFGEAAYLLPQLFAPKTPKYIQYSWRFRDFNLRQNIHRPLDN